MAKVSVRNLDDERKQRTRGLRMRSKRIRRPDGGVETIYSVDLASPTFDIEFSALFQKAVNQARRENKRVIGQADVEPNGR